MTLSETHGRIEAERVMARVRIGAGALYVLAAAVRPGDSTSATVSIGLVLLLVGTLALRAHLVRSPDLRVVGAVLCAFDFAVFLALLANNLTDPSDDVYITGLFPVLEGALRWGRAGGAALGAITATAVAGWTAVIGWRAGEAFGADDVTVRTGAMLLIGWAVGSVVRNLQDQQLALRHALGATRDAVVTLDRYGAILSANEPCGQVLGRSPATLVGRRFRDLLAPEANGRDNPLAAGSADPSVIEVPLVRDDGACTWVEVRVTPVPRLGIAYAACRDVTARREATTRLSHEALHDPLTDLPNRRHLTERLHAAVGAGQGRPALLFLDLDGFKAVNDTYGHDAGDDVLRQVAGRLLTAVRDHDTVARLAGDEFCVLLLSAGDDVVRMVADRLVAQLAGPFVLPAGTVRLGVSVGGVSLRSGEMAEELMRRADRVMYEAKHAGGGRAHLVPCLDG